MNKSKCGRKPIKKELKRVAMGVSVAPTTRDTLERIREEYGVTPGAALDIFVRDYAGKLFAV